MASTDKSSTKGTRKPPARRSTAKDAGTPRRRGKAKAGTAPEAPARRSSGWTAGVLGGLGALVAGGAVALVLRLRRSGRAEGHVPTDLMGDQRPGPHDRAPEAFRPDPTAPVSADEREALRPPPGPGPTLVAGQARELAEP